MLIFQPEPRIVHAKTYNLSMLFSRAGDLPSAWVAHVLDFDLVTQGDTLQHAMAMALEATALVAKWDVEQGKDPLDRRAPDAEWARFYEIAQHGQPLAGLQLPDENQFEALALLALCVFDLDAVDPQQPVTPTPRKKAAPRSAEYRRVLSWPEHARAA